MHEWVGGAGTFRSSHPSLKPDYVTESTMEFKYEAPKKKYKTTSLVVLVLLFGRVPRDIRMEVTEFPWRYIHSRLLGSLELCGDA